MRISSSKRPPIWGDRLAYKRASGRILGQRRWDHLIVARHRASPHFNYQTRMYPCRAAGYSLSPELQPELWAYLGLITLALVLVNLGSLMLGFVLMRRALITGHTHLAAVTASAVASCAVAAAAWAHDRVFSYGSTHAFGDGRAANIVETPSAWLCLLAYGACALCVRQAARRARDLRAPIS